MQMTKWEKCRNNDCPTSPNKIESWILNALSGFCSHKCHNEYYKYDREGM